MQLKHQVLASVTFSSMPGCRRRLRVLLVSGKHGARLAIILQYLYRPDDRRSPRRTGAEAVPCHPALSGHTFSDQMHRNELMHS